MKRVLTLPALLVAFPLVAQEAPKALSLQEAIETSLKNNLQVGIAESNRDFTKAGVLLEEGSFDWNLGASVNVSKTTDTQFTNPTTQEKATFFNRTATASVLKPFEWGGTFNATYAPKYSVSEAPSQTSSGKDFAYDGSFSASYTQSLLRGFGREASATRLIVARNGAKVADLSYQKAIIDLVAATESAYWDVVFAKVNLDNKQQSLELAQKQLKENEIRVQVGTLAPIEVTSAQATVAQREQDIISAEAQLLNAKDALIRALYPNVNKPAAIDATDMPTVSPIAMEEPASERMAIEKRVELKSAKLNLDSSNVQERAANNRLLPQLDASVGYTGGAAKADKLSPVNSDLTGGKYPGYNVGLTFSIPIFNKAARGAQAQARANRRQTELTYKDQQLSIVLEVRTAYRNLEAAGKGVSAAEKTRVFREKDLEAEQKKFENGMSTNFLVLSKQNDLDSAKSNELQARIGYAKAVTALEKAQGSLLEARKLSL
ncbi:MAG TPA: TolC family protein [Holophagaceae bacterium]|nr:TolC family protein [Holophagaceae bacterium]